MANRLDRIISALAPGWAVQREIARHDLKTVQSFSTSAYASGDTLQRERKHAAFGRSAMSDEEAAATAFGYDAMRLEAMDLYRNNPLARALVETVRRYGRQSVPRASTASVLESEKADMAAIEAAQEWDRTVTDWFSGWFWPRADALRRPGVTFGTLQDMFVTLQFTQGDMAFVYTGDGFLAVEGIQIRTPSRLMGDKKIRHGFRRNSSGQITHMYVCPFGYHGGIDTTNFNRYPISSVIFCPWYWRAAQFRAVPRLHGVIDSLRDSDEIHGNVKRKVKHESMLLSVERSGSRKKAPGSKITQADGTEVTYEQADYGMRFRTTGKPGDDFTFAQGVTPNAEYVPLMEHDAMRIAAGVGIPYKVLMSLYDGSWSSNKAAQVALKVLVNEMWAHRRDVFTQRAYNVVVAEAIRGGYLPPAPVNAHGISLFNRAEWSKPFFPQLDQQKEEAGRTSGFQNFTASFDGWADEEQTTAEAMFRNRKKTVARIKADAEELGVPIELYAGSLLAKSSSVSAASGSQPIMEGDDDEV